LVLPLALNPASSRATATEHKPSILLRLSICSLCVLRGWSSSLEGRVNLVQGCCSHAFTGYLATSPLACLRVPLAFPCVPLPSCAPCDGASTPPVSVLWGQGPGRQSLSHWQWQWQPQSRQWRNSEGQRLWAES
jgi:hypothetical protein